MLQRLAVTILPAIFIGFALSCSLTNENQVDKFAETAKKNEPKRENFLDDSVRNIEKITDNGDFLVEHSKTKIPRFETFEQKLRQEKMLEIVAEKLNQSLNLTYDIKIRSKDCGEVNALYDSSDRSISVCYELLEHFFISFRNHGENEEKAEEKMFEAVRFAFLHELGHALIDVYDLPLTGSEEDAADRLSAYLCFEELGEIGIKAIISAVDAFKIEAKNKSADENNLSDEHLLNKQRFYNTVCLVYGSDTEKYKYFVNENYLPSRRADRCSNEYQKMVKSWSKLLENRRKNKQIGSQ